MAGLCVLVSEAAWMNSCISDQSVESRTGESDRSPEVKDAENKANHDDVPCSVPHSPWSHKEFRNTVKRCAESDVLEYEQAMGQQKQCACNATHQNLPGGAQILSGSLRVPAYLWFRLNGARR